MTMKQSRHEPVAIIGIGCMFAKSPDHKAFLNLLMRGINAITDPPETHRFLNDYLDSDPKRTDHIYCNRGGYLSPVNFDPSEFGIPPAALEATDTSQLLGLMVAKQALEDAGYGADGRSYDREKTSVILGVTGTQELVIPLGARLGHPIWRRALSDAGVSPEVAEDVIERIAEGYVPWQENSFPGLLGNVVAGRIANRLDLGGTNCVVDAACASSMSAIHMGVLELASGRSDMVLTGGVDTINDAFMHMCFSRTQILSKSGDIRPFSKDADGTVLGEGVGMVVLKRLEDARRDGDRIYAVLRGMGTASDGKSQSIYAPRQSGQEMALKRAYRNTGVAPESIDMIEAHGTGTRVGDQVEFKALCEVFKSAAVDGERCALGSVKSNIGHTKAAAGTAGLIKAALSLYHKVKLPTLKADPTDPNLNVDDSPFYINHHLKPWSTGKTRVRRAGVSAFGFGGSNFHAVLEEHSNTKDEPSWDGSVEIAAFSADEKEAVIGSLEQWAGEISKCEERDDIARLAARSRQGFDPKHSFRLAMVFDPHDPVGSLSSLCQEARERLERFDGIDTPAVSNGIFIGSGDGPGGLAFLFPGQGSQYVGMGRDLVCCFPECLEVLQEADDAIQIGHALSSYIYASSGDKGKTAEDRLRSTDIAQPAIGTISVALLAVLKRFGVAPDAVCGHSYGELTALHAAGRIDRPALWRLSEARGKLMADAGNAGESSDPGSMLAVMAPIAGLDRMIGDLPDGVVLANRNAPQQGVLSGPTPAVEAAERHCKDRGYRCVRLPVAAAFHSRLVSAARKPFRDTIDQVPFNDDASAVVMSNSLGGPYPEQAESVKEVLAGQLALPVDFITNIENLHKDGITTFVEVGPKAVLTRMVEQILDGSTFQALSVDGSAGHENGLNDLAHVLARLAVSGYPVQLQGWEKPLPAKPAKRMRISLSGTNYKTSRPVRPPAKPAREKPPRSVQQSTAGVSQTNAMDANEATAAQPPRLPQRDKGAPSVGRPESKVMDPKQRDYLNHTLSAVQQGLASMQALQSQTTEAHQKYLQAQAEASRTLQQMMRSTEQLAAAAMGDTRALPSIPAQVPAIDAAAGPSETPAETTPVASVAPEQAQTSAKVDQSGHHHQVEAEKRPSIESELVKIVEELTGYPEEMLGLEMDIESDLGIDSIKRVEILSAMEDRMPDLPKVTPDMVGTLKTLGQLCEYLSSRQGSASPAPVETAPQPSASNSQDIEGVRQELVKIVEELTGYPEEMLGLEMDIESDLGIDSIKRVEILSAMEDRMPDLPKVTPDMVGTLKTLGQLCEYLSGPHNRKVPVKESERSVIERIESGSPSEASKEVARYRIQVIDQPIRKDKKIRLQSPFVIALVSPGDQLGDALQKSAVAADLPVIRLETLDDVTPETKLAGLVITAPMEPGLAFQWAQKCSDALLEAARSGCDPFFYTVTRLDGAFGFTGSALSEPEQGAMAGLAKTAALEWPEIRCAALDVDPFWDDDSAVGEAVIDEIVSGVDETAVEIGLGKERRIGLALVPCPQGNGQPIDLNEADVVVVTGGARGVTAAAATALSERTPCHLALLGRSPQPMTEPAWLNGISDEGAMKKAIMTHASKDTQLTPKALEKSYRQWVSNRQIKSTIHRLTANGCRVSYFCLDVTDSDAVMRTIAKIRSDIGEIKAIIHGAGILEDRLIKDKILSDFNRVYDTKVKGLSNILEATEKDHLAYIVLFSSVSARMGNPGQVDYAMANEVLNKTALQQARLLPECKVVSINWGPWDGGMVTPSLKRIFESEGISLIPVQAGAEAMVSEMAEGREGPVEVVMGGHLPSGMPQHLPDPGADSNENQGAACEPSPMMMVAAKRDINVGHYPILEAHRLDGRPVVPFALMTEWLAHGALHANPGLSFYGIDNLRLFKGIVLDEQTKRIHLMADNPKRRDDLYEVNVEVRDGKQNGNCQVHSSATALLADRFPNPPSFEENGHFKETPYARNLNEIYDHILFHGDALRGIEKIIHISDKGLTANVRSAPSPEQWLKDPMRSRWIADPLVMDCAFQMAIIWCYEHHQMVSLPSYAAAYRQYRDRFPTQGVTAVLDVVGTTDRKLKADFTFLDREKKVIARMTGYEAVMDQSLIKAFGVKAA